MQYSHWMYVASREAFLKRTDIEEKRSFDKQLGTKCERTEWNIFWGSTFFYKINKYILLQTLNTRWALMDYWIFTCSKKRLEGTKFETLRKKNELSCWIQLIEPQSMEWEFRELTTSPEVLMRGIFCKKKIDKNSVPSTDLRYQAFRKFFHPIVYWVPQFIVRKVKIDGLLLQEPYTYYWF